tara:strand:- start:232 stop:777 length:546 start_codon:yes stop_codon:yes gene_type:complete
MSSFGTSAKSGMALGPLDEWQTFARPTHKHTDALFKYWTSKRGDAETPLRSTIDPVEMPRLLPMISLLEVESPQPVRFRVRLFGTSVADIVGEDRTGRYLDDFGKDLGTNVRKEIIGRWQQTCQAVYDEGRPLFVSGLRRTPQKEHQTVHAAALPLTKGSGSVDYVLGLLTTESTARSHHL